MRNRLSLVLLAILGTFAAPGTVSAQSCYVVPPRNSRCPVPEWTWPGNRRQITAYYFDPSYTRDPAAAPPAQHLGIDMNGSVGDPVLSPVSGTLIRVHYDSNPRQSYIVIRETSTGLHHILGHVMTTLQVGRTIGRGQRVATIQRWPGSDHVHWGIARDIDQATQSSRDPRLGTGDWGWGRAPRDATRAQAEARGFIDPAAYMR
jgi:murein DD-endopeptidase MepM/ murein hydrolase activator NlpD